jgi:hypothetical protein
MFTNIKPLINRLTVFCLAVFVSLIVPGVTFAEIGRIHLNKKVQAAFEAYKFNPNYNYYFANLENNPCAVIGLQKGYEVGDILWQKVRPDSDEFKKVIEMVKRFPMSGLPAFGAYILDYQGNTIGEYYSSAGAGVDVNKEMKKIMLSIYMSGSHHN